MGCKLSSETTTTSVKVSKISASAESRSITTRETVVDITTDTELWLMPTRRGWNEPIQSSNVFDIKKYTPNAQGEFSITGEDFPNSTFVIFVMDANKINNGTDKIDKEAILGFLTLNSDDRPVIECPPANEIIGEISFGDVLITDDYYTTSTLGLEENRGAFTPEMLEN